MPFCEKIMLEFLKLTHRIENNDQIHLFEQNTESTSRL